MKHGLLMRTIAAAALFAAQSCTTAPPREPSALVRQVLDVDTPNYTGGLNSADRDLARRIANSLAGRFYAACEPPNSFMGVLISLGDDGSKGLPSLRRVDPDLAFLIRALENPRQEVRDVAAYTIGLLGPSASAAQPFLEAKFRARDTKGGWYGLALERVSCQPVGAPGYTQTIPDEVLHPSDAPQCPSVVMAKLYLDPDVEYPPGMLIDAYESFDRISLGFAGPVIQEILERPGLSDRKYMEAIVALGKLDMHELEKVLPRLLEFAESENEALRYYVGTHLIRLRHDRAVGLLIERVRDDAWEGDWARDLCEFGERARAAEAKLLEVALRTDWARVQHQAVETLRCVGSDKSVPVLVSMLDGYDWQLSEAAATTLGKLGVATPDVVAALTALSEHHWSARVRKAGLGSLVSLGVRAPEPRDPNNVIEEEEIVIGGPPGPFNHGLPWCDESGRYSIDGKSWFMVKWMQPTFEPVPPGFPRKNVFLQSVGTQAFLRVSDGWLIGSDGFESEGTFAHVSDRGVVTEMEASEPGVPFGHAAIRGIVHTRSKYFAFGFEILKVGDAGTLFEVSRSRDGKWSPVNYPQLVEA